MTNNKVCMNKSKYDSIIQENEKLATKLNNTILNINKSKKCDKKCKADKLKQKYLDSQQNLMSAPQEEEIAYKNYVVFTEGELKYNEIENTMIAGNADGIILEIMNNFKEAVTKIKISIDSYGALLINYKNVLDLYIKYLKENIELTKKLKSGYSNVITNDRKTYYEDQGIENLNFIYFYILMIIYIIVIICYCVFAFLFKSNMSNIAKIVIFVIFLILPFISTKLLQLFISICERVYHMLPKNTYSTL